MKNSNNLPFAINLLSKNLFLTLILLTLVTTAFAQKKSEFMHWEEENKKVVNLTERVMHECTGIIKEGVGQSIVEVRFQPQFASEAKEISLKLKKVVERTQAFLSPLPVQGVRYYLLQMADIPKSYKIVLSNQDDLLLYMDIFGKKEDVSQDCVRNPEFCESLFHTLPHEITHPAVGRLIDHKKTRWFDDGLAEYVGTEINREFVPGVVTREKDIYAQTMLHSDEIRQQLFDWGDLRFFFTVKMPKQIRNEAKKYQAAQQLIRLTLEESEKKGVENPLAVLLEKLTQFTAQKSKAATGEELIAIIAQHLKVDVRTLGRLSVQTQKSLVQEAVEILAKEKNLPNSQNKFYALNVLASIDEIALSDKWINYLLDEVYNRKAGDDYLWALAATAVVVRFNQKGFEETLKNYVSGNEYLKSKSTKKIKEELEKLSIRPKPH